jgi:hypothetical protein
MWLVLLVLLLISSLLSTLYFFFKGSKENVEFCDAIYNLYLETIIKAEKTPEISQNLKEKTKKLVDYYRKNNMLPDSECHTDLEFIKKIELITPRLFKSLNVSVPTQILL